jgi:hypothetical protein
MDLEIFRERITQAIDNRIPEGDVLDIVWEFKKSGGLQKDAYNVFLEILKRMDDSDSCYDYVADMMDIVGGWCNPANRIWPGYDPDIG